MYQTKVWKIQQKLYMDSKQKRGCAFKICKGKCKCPWGKIGHTSLRVYKRNVYKHTVEDSTKDKLRKGQLSELVI